MEWGFNFLPSKKIYKELRSEIASLQQTIEILVAKVESKYTTGNPYTEYLTAVRELASKYEGTARWGVQEIRNIIDLRSAFIIGQGIRWTATNPEKYKRELEFINSFVEHNNLDEEIPQELAKEAEIEGRILLRLIPNKDKKNIDIRFISYSVNNYKVETDPNDYQHYIGVKYTSGGTDVTLKEEEFIYKKFCGRMDKANDIMPKTAMVLRHCEDLDKALWDLRVLNNLFASPTPYVKFQDMQSAKEMLEHMKNINWRIGKMLTGTGEFSLVSLSGTGSDSLVKEITNLAKIISGATGVPVHFLGLPDLMSNRAVSTDLFEAINASTNKERHVWVGFYEELFNKAFKMMNTSEETKSGFALGEINVSILQMTEAKIKELSEVWLPLYMASVIDIDYFLSKIPDIDPQKAKQNLNKSVKDLLGSIKEGEEEESEEGTEEGGAEE
jgi:hypothetical protein